MTGSDNLMNYPAQMFNNVSPIRTVITTITRNSVNIFVQKGFCSKGFLFKRVFKGFFTEFSKGFYGVLRGFTLFKGA